LFSHSFPRIFPPRSHVFVPVFFVVNVKRLAEGQGTGDAEGGEAVRDVISAYFTPILRTVEKFGGDVLKFAGDALLCSFPAEKCAEAAKAALQTAKYEQSFSIGQQKKSVVLRNRVALAYGGCESFHAGTARRTEYVLSGSPLRDLSLLIDGSEAGEVAVSETFLSALRAGAHVLKVDVGEPERSDMRRRFQEVGAQTMKSVKLSKKILVSDDSSSSSSWELRSRMLAKAESDSASLSFFQKRVFAYLPTKALHLAELRTVATLFVNLSGLEQDNPRLTDIMSQATEEAVATCEAFGGVLRQRCVFFSSSSSSSFSSSSCFFCGWLFKNR
jgi:class 3 adenylate cyclase